MSLTANGLVKLIEECGELIQICSKRLAYPDTAVHPDGNELAGRMEQELGDVLGAIRTVVILDKRLNMIAIQQRAQAKCELFLAWNEEP